MGGPSERIDRYLLVEQIGKGGMGVVYRAFDPRLKRHIALKQVSGEADERLLREAQAMAQLSHPAVVQVYDAGIASDAVFIAMELIDGLDLRKWLKTQRPWQQILDVFLRAADGLAAAHAVGIVHRDFKPSNVLVSSTGRVVVSDFGLARPEGLGEHAIDLPEPPRPEADVTLTLSGPGKGTPRYMAPEQYINRVVDARADQYSFCVALDEALAASGAPARVREIVQPGMSVEPASRYGSMRELAIALRGACEAKAAAPRSRNWIPGVAAIAAIALVAAVALAGEPAVASDPAPAADSEFEPEIVVANPDSEEIVLVDPEPPPEEIVIVEPEPEPPRRTPRKKKTKKRDAKKAEPPQREDRRPDPDGLIRDLWKSK